MYNPFNQIEPIFQSLLTATYNDQNGNQLTNYNLDRYKNNILPNYDYVVLQSTDFEFINLLKTMNSQFRLEENVNSQIFIFKNINLNLKNQENFMAANNLL